MSKKIKHFFCPWCRPKNKYQIREFFYKETGKYAANDPGFYLEWIEEKLIAKGFKKAAKRQTTRKVD